MNIDELKEYREKLGKLTQEEEKQRNLYLKKLANGTLQGPLTGKQSIDKTWLKYYSDEAILIDLPEMTALNYMKNNNKNNSNGIALNFFGLKITYKKLFEKIDEVAESLVSYGVRAGDIVVINSVTLPQTIFLLYALNKIGAIADLTDLRTDSNGMKHYLNEGKTKLVFTLDSCYLGFKDILNENDDIVLKMPYVMSSTIMIPRVLKPILMQQCVTRKFIGVDKLEDGDEDEIVYMTPNGGVAHKSSGCTYIKSSIISVEGNSIGSRRNTSGGKYYPCRKCVKEEQNMYYVTEYGTRYHADLACSVIARNAYPIKLSVLKKVKMCSKCGSDE